MLLVKALQAQYISEVLEYKPAPGQLTNSAPWGVPNSANSLVGGITGSMSLGAFGGYVIFKFENPVENHPDNPFAVDFTIFGNPLNNFAEHGIVSVMKDENGNGLPDDTWYELAGSDYFFSSTIKGYEVTYTNPNHTTAANVPWADNYGNSGIVLTNTFHDQPYYPLIDLFPDVNSTEYTLSGTLVANEVVQTTASNFDSYRKAFGYADNQIRGTTPYTVPDNPYTLGAENSGGDAFDISWAVNENGEYVDLDVIHFVKVHTGVLADAGWLGEISTEITGAVIVTPNASITGVLDMIVIKSLPDTIRGENYQLEAFAFHKGRRDLDKTIVWTTNLEGASVNSNNLLTFTNYGKITLTASLEDMPEITATATVILANESNPSSILLSQRSDITLYPNPATDHVFIKGAEHASIEIYSITGNRVLQKLNYSDNQPLPIANLASGVYIIKVQAQNLSKAVRFIKK
jgi:hypothetical protein